MRGIDRIALYTNPGVLRVQVMNRLPNLSRIFLGKGWCPSFFIVLMRASMLALTLILTYWNFSWWLHRFASIYKSSKLKCWINTCSRYQQINTMSLQTYQYNGDIIVSIGWGYRCYDVNNCIDIRPIYWGRSKRESLARPPSYQINLCGRERDQPTILINCRRNDEAISDVRSYQGWDLRFTLLTKNDTLVRRKMNRWQWFRPIILSLGLQSGDENWGLAILCSLQHDTA